MDKTKVKAMAREIYYSAYIFKQFAIMQNSIICSEEAEAVEVYSYYLMHIADNLYYYLNICEENG